MIRERVNVVRGIQRLPEVFGGVATAEGDTAEQPPAPVPAAKPTPREEPRPDVARGARQPNDVPEPKAGA